MYRNILLHVALMIQESTPGSHCSFPLIKIPVIRGCILRIAIFPINPALAFYLWKTPSQDQPTDYRYEGQWEAKETGIPGYSRCMLDIISGYEHLSSIRGNHAARAP